MCEDKWQAIESAPKDGTPILISGWLDGSVGSKRFVAQGQWDDCNGGGWYGGEDDGWASPFFEPITHWQPLPQPPKPEGE